MGTRISNSIVKENNPIGEIVGTFSSMGGQSYTLISGDGGDGNCAFWLHGNSLKAATMFDYESKNTYSIRVRTAYADGTYHDDTFPILVSDTNESPSKLKLDNNTIKAYSPAGTAVGTLSSKDPDGSQVTYSVVGGAVSSFEIVNGKLVSKVEFGAAAKGKQNIEVVVRATDSGGLYVDRTFVIAVVSGNRPLKDRHGKRRLKGKVISSVDHEISFDTDSSSLEAGSIIRTPSGRKYLKSDSGKLLSIPITADPSWGINEEGVRAFETLQKMWVD